MEEKANSVCYLNDTLLFILKDESKKMIELNEDESKESSYINKIKDDIENHISFWIDVLEKRMAFVFVIMRGTLSDNVYASIIDELRMKNMICFDQEFYDTYQETQSAETIRLEVIEAVSRVIHRYISDVKKKIILSNDEITENVDQVLCQKIIEEFKILTNL